MVMEPVIDSHAHLDHLDFKDAVEGVLARAREATVSQIITVASTLESARASLKLAQEHPELFATAGIHPHDAADARPGDMQEVEDLGRLPAVVAVGETGLDYHYDLSPREKQRELFARHAEMALRLDKPLIIHIREAHDDAVAILKEVRGPEIKGVVHCFTGDLPQARQYLKMGLHISFSGIVTFPKSEQIQEVAAWAPVDRILVETDSPYLAPVPFRGKRNEPSYVVHTGAFVARLRKMEVDELARITSQNTRALFGLPCSA